MSSMFSEAMSVGPPKKFEDPMSYPAIKGNTRIINVTFSNFDATTGCGPNYVWMTTDKYGDIIHPTEFKEITLRNVDEATKVHCILHCENNLCTSLIINQLNY